MRTRNDNSGIDRYTEGIIYRNTYLVHRVNICILKYEQKMLISDGQHFHEKKQLNGKLYLTSIIEEVKGVDTAMEIQDLDWCNPELWQY